MQHWLDRLTDLAALRGDETILKDALSLFAGQAGFGGYAHLYIRPGHTFAASSYHPEWRTLYIERKFEAVVSIVNCAKSLKQPFSWSGAQKRRRFSKEEREYFDRADYFGNQAKMKSITALRFPSPD